MPRADRHLTDTRATTGRKVGRPRAVVPADAAKRIEALAGAGYSLIGIASKLGTTRGTLSQWLDHDPALREAFEAGREHERHTLHNVLFTLATEKNNPIAAMFLLKARHGYREGDQGVQANRVSINFTLPGAMRPEQFTIEQESTNDRSPENLALPKSGAIRS